jgi:lipopolysaccharide transport system permease protein
MVNHLKAVWTFRYFWLSLVRMDLRSRYRRSVLGIGWSLLNPILMSAVFCLVFSTMWDISGGRWAEFGYSAPWRGYAAYLLCGMAVWEFLRNSLSIGCVAIINNEAYIRQCPLPYGIYPLRTVMGTGIHFLISLCVVLVLVSVMKGSTSPFHLLWTVIPIVLLMFVFCWSIATLAAFATVYFHDTTHLVEVGAQLMFFLTPIMYDRKLLDNTQISWLPDVNPIVVFLDLIRNPIVYGIMPDTVLCVKAVGMTVVAFGLACGTIGWLQKKVVFNL